MFVSVDTTVRLATVALVEPEDCARFHLAVTGGDELAVREALASSGTGTLVDRNSAVVAVDAVRSLARGHVGADWPDRFAAMLAYAEKKGWLTADGAGVQAHCEWQ